MLKIIQEIKNCRVCEEFLPGIPNPIFTIHPLSKICIVGQAPGRTADMTGVPWNDRSGDVLREWLGIDRILFYNPELFSLMPMGFCYPGKGPHGDLAPRPECAAQWHRRILQQMSQIQLTILIGHYAQRYYLPSCKHLRISDNVKQYSSFLPGSFPLPHPSPRNRIWIKRHPWFSEEVLPELKMKIQSIIKS